MFVAAAAVRWSCARLKHLRCWVGVPVIANLKRHLNPFDLTVSQPLQGETESLTLPATALYILAVILNLMPQRPTTLFSQIMKIGRGFSPNQSLPVIKSSEENQVHANQRNPLADGC